MDNDIVDFLKSQHEQIKTLFAQTLSAVGSQRQQLFAQLAALLKAHEAAEETVVHPVAKNNIPSGDTVVAKRVEEENEAKVVLAALEKMDVQSPEFESKLRALQSAVLAHAASEEKQEFNVLGETLDEPRLQRMRQDAERIEAGTQADAPTVRARAGRKFAVVTGASSGIGLELAKQFAQHGYDLLIAAENAEIIAVVPELLAFGAKVDVLQVDLATYEGVEKLYLKIKARGVLDAIAINAGVGVGGDFARQTELQDELNLINLNVISTVHLAKRVVTDLIAQGHGRILFTASIAGTMPGPFEAVYAASKAFVLSFSEAIREELKDTGVSVTALMPGATETNFFHRAGMDDTKVGASKKVDPAEVAKQGFEALMAGKDSVVAGSLQVKLEGALNEILPETTKAAMHAKQAKPGSAHKR